MRDLEPAISAAAAFIPAGADGRFESLGAGHIHTTWAVRWGSGDAACGIALQQLNTHVFRDPQQLAANIGAVTVHLRQKLAAEGCADAERRSLEVVPAHTGDPLHFGADGAPWRAFRLIEGTRTLLDSPTLGEAEAAARAFGAFARRLADLNQPLAATIPKFHDFNARLQALEASARSGDAERLHGGRDELAAQRDLVARLAPTLAALATLPRRVAHHDTKLSNVLFDRDSEDALCVVDLDTVMPGTLVSDFGELTRSACGAGAEDDPDAAGIDLDRFASLARGYAAETRDLLIAEERRVMPLAGALMALMNAVRFLTDHLDGDRYFRVIEPDQNLSRATAQRRLAAEMLACADQLRDCVAAAYSNS